MKDRCRAAGQRLSRATTMHPGWVVVAWLAVTVGAGTAGWMGRDALSSSVLGGDASTEERLVRSSAEPLQATGRHLVCAPDYAFGRSTERMPWVDLESAGAERVSQQAGLCYLTMWDGLAVAPSVDAPPDRAPAAITAVARSTPQAAIPLLSPDFLESWQADTETSSLPGATGAGIHADLARAERIALPLTFVLLLVATRHLAQAVLPLLAGTSVTVVTAGILTLLAQQVTISVYAVSVVTMLGLALGIDYALLWVLGGGRRFPAGASVGEAPVAVHDPRATILVAGAVVFGTSLGLLALPLAIIHEVVLGIAIAVLVAMLAAITLVPSLIQLTTRTTRFSIPGIRTPALRVGPTQPGSRRSRPVGLMAVAALLILVGLGWQATSLRTAIGIPAPTAAQTRALAAEPYDAWMQDAMREVRLSSVEIGISGGQDEGALHDMLASIGADQDLAPMVIVDAFSAERVYVLRAIVVRPIGSARAAEAIDRVRSAASGIQARHPDVTVNVGGPLERYDRVVIAIGERQLWAGLLAVSIAGVLMTVLMGTPLLSLLAVGGSLLSCAAALGALVLVVQEGIGASLLGVEQAAHIEAWAPIVMFCVLVGVGIDYHVFLSSGVKAAMARGAPLTAAITQGYRAVGPVVVMAALSMTLVFGGFVGGDVGALQQLGIGLAFGVVLDAFLVRLLLVPVTLIAVDRLGLRSVTPRGLGSWRPGRRADH